MPQISSGLRRIFLAFAAGGISCTAGMSSAASLTPQQVAVIINGNNPNSWSIARFYARERHIPKMNLIVLSGLPHDAVQIPVDTYDIHVSAAIRRILRERQLKKTIRCLVTTWGIPLRVAGMGTSPQITLELQQIQQGLQSQVRQLTLGIAQLNALAATSPTSTLVTKPAPPVGGPPVTQAAQLALQHFGQALNNAVHRVGLLPPIRRQAAFAKLLPLLAVYIGPGGVGQTIHIHGSSAVAQKDHQTLAAMKKDVQKYLPELIRLSQRRYLEKDRLELRELQLKLFGVVGLTRQLLSDTIYLQQKPSSTALDSDLMTVWYQPDAAMGMENNPMYMPNWTRSVGKLQTHIPLMVSRLDGTSPKMVRNMILTSVRVQKTGLRGVAYFDARGLHGQDPYSQYDRLLRHTALFILQNTGMPVALQDTPAFFQSKNCPDEAIYCGWYSLEHYLPSCQWLPGSVAFHVASFELLSLHNPNYGGWCPHLLKHGVCGTLGAVAEPYLTAFPPPNLFFPLLLSGRFTQAQVYYLTCPLVDWRIAYVGDPLYNPFEHHHVMRLRRLLKYPIFRRAFEEFKIPIPKVATVKAPAH
ncbi:MAG: TIGR03790 family protein [Phycisphaerae bacterium]|nr:TIGR03790 family protein [Phycisphaerae bacterium]